MNGPVRNVGIVLVDDDPEDRMLIREALAEAMVTNPLAEVEDGDELLRYLTRPSPATSGLEPGGLILLDLNLPGKDGLQVLRELKQHPRLRRIPVVVLTTSTATEDVEESYALGASSFISKPTAFGELVRLMRTLGDYWFAAVRLPAEVAPHGAA